MFDVRAVALAFVSLPIRMVKNEISAGHRMDDGNLVIIGQFSRVFMAMQECDLVDGRISDTGGRRRRLGSKRQRCTVSPA